MIAGTVAAGVVTTIKSGIPGKSAIDLYAGSPSTLGRFGFTGHTGPPNGLAIRLVSTVQPTLPARSDAPTTATDFGAKIAASGLVRTPTRSCAGSMMRVSSGTTAGAAMGRFSFSFEFCSMPISSLRGHFTAEQPIGRNDV